MLSFKDYLVISNALNEAELDEGKIWDAIKKSLGGSPSDEDIQKELDKAKSALSKTSKTIKTVQKVKSAAEKSADEHKDMLWRAAQFKTKSADMKGSQVASPHGKKNDRSEMSANNDLAQDLSPAQHSKMAQVRRDQWLRRRANEEAKLNAEAEILKEGQSEFIVAFTSDEDKKEKVTLKGRDAREIRRKFGDLFVGCKLLTIRPK